MSRRRRKNLTEVNLTPLLDVLFSILFIVMMTGAQSMDSMQSDHREEVATLQNENEELREALRVSEDQLAAYELHESDSVILTVRNIVKNSEHYLVIYRGIDEQEIDSIKLGINNTENTGVRIRSLVGDIISENGVQPVYIIFYCDKTSIYTKEYNAVVGAFDELQTKYKEVFFKTGEEN